jgi:hypothetical protein
MPYRFERLPDEPILIIDLSEFNLLQEVDDFARDIEAIWASYPGDFYEIMDVRNIRITFNDIVQGLGKATRGQQGEIRSVPSRMRLRIFIANSELVRFGVKALRQVQYGSMPAALADSMDEALALAREALREQAPLR